GANRPAGERITGVHVRTEHHAAALGEAQLGVMDLPAVVARYNESLFEAECLLQEVDATEGVAIAQTGPDERCLVRCHAVMMPAQARRRLGQMGVLGTATSSV